MSIQASVIVPTRNRAPVLRSCLASLQRQTLPAECFEVIVVDNGSQDDTAAVAQSFAGALQLRLLHEAEPGLHEAEPGLHVGRHAGWRAARSELLMFCDDDIQAGDTWVQAVVQHFADPAVMLVGGNNHPDWEGTPPDWLQRWWQRPAGRGRALGALSVLDFGAGCFDIDPGWVWGCNFSVRAAVLQACGGFHPDGVPREHLRLRGDGESHVSNAVRAAGGRSVFDSAASVHHRVDAPRMTPAYFEQRAFAQGVSDSYAEIRRTGRPRAACTPALPRWQHWLGPLLDRRVAGWSPRDATTVAWRDVLAGVRRGHAAGWAFHQREVAADPALLDWVRRADYL